MNEKNLAQENQASALEIDLDGLEVEDIEVFFQEGSLGMPVYAASTASCATCSAANSCSSSKGGL